MSSPSGAEAGMFSQSMAGENPIADGGTIPQESADEIDMTDAEFSRIWTLGIGGDRSLGKPKEWNGDPEGFDDFVFKYSN